MQQHQCIESVFSGGAAHSILCEAKWWVIDLSAEAADINVSKKSYKALARFRNISIDHE